MPFGGTWTNDDYDTGTQAAAAGGVTCLVDFALQMHPGGLRSSLEEWQGRAEGAAHVDYGFHMAITKADDGTFADMPAMVDEGVTTFKVFLAYPRRADGHRRPLPGACSSSTKETGGLVMVHAENGDGIDYLVQQGAGRRQHRPDLPRAHAPRGARGRGDGPRDPPGRVRGHADLHRPRVLQARPPTRSSRPARAASRRTARPASSTCSPRSTTCAGPTSRARATSARRRCARRANQPHMWDALIYDHLQSISTDHCPFTDEQKRLGLGDFSKIPNGLACDPAPPAADVGARRARGPHVDEPPGRGHLDGHREDLRPAPAQGHDRAGRRRRHRDLRPEPRSSRSRPTRR